MLITEDYKKLNLQLHNDNPLYGTSGHKYASVVLDIAGKINTKDILDYGCGKQTLEKELGFSINNYDPCITELSASPQPADLVVCTDVMEHIEPDCLDDVLAHLRILCKKAIFLSVATRPARKTLADGRNAHLIIESGQWWFNKISEFFIVKSYNHQDGEVWFICQKK